MPTFFETAKRSFKDVPITDDKIATTEFLEASESLVTLFDILGATAFAAVKKDMTGNIKKIRDRQLAHPAESETLQDLVNNELAEKKKTASEGLLWLNRGLEFTSQALRKNCDTPNEELTDSFTKAYGDTLKQHHNFMVKGVFTVAMKACPYRADFYKQLGGDDAAETERQLKEWLVALEKIVAILNAFLATVKI